MYPRLVPGNATLAHVPDKYDDGERPAEAARRAHMQPGQRAPRVELPPVHLVHGHGRCVAPPPRWLLTAPGPLEAVLTKPPLALLVPLRFFRIEDGEAVDLSDESVQDDAPLQEPEQDPWETTREHRRRVDRLAALRRCERRLYECEKSFALNVTLEDVEDVCMYWVVFPTRPKVPRDPSLRGTARAAAAAAAQRSYDETEELRASVRRGTLDCTEGGADDEGALWRWVSSPGRV